MELKHLRSFIAVAEQLSFVRAARRLHLSQPALSGQIRRLEQELDVQLLIRNRRIVKLAPAGKVFLAEARATLERADEARERARRAARGESGKLRIGFVSSAALEIVPEIVVTLRKRHPKVMLDLQNVRTVNQVEALLHKTLDVGFLRLPLGHEQLEITVIHREPFVVALPAGHRLARKKIATLSLLRDEKFVAYGRRWAPGFLTRSSRCAPLPVLVRRSFRKPGRCTPQSRWSRPEPESQFCRGRSCWPS